MNALVAIRAYERRMRMLRQRWTEGPWRREPDREEWTSLGFSCLILRAEFTGVLNGYVGVKPSHVLYGTDDGDEALAAHGGITFMAPSTGAICQVDDNGNTSDLWWFGFDCGHYLDLSPALVTISSIFNGRYRNLRYVREEVEQLAGQLAIIGSRRKRGAAIAKKVLSE